jgi:N-acetylneuraminic acid mutarotase
VEDTSFPGPARNYAVAVADPANSTIYYGTGNDNGTAFLSDWWAYHVLTHRWTQLRSFQGGPRYSAVGFLLNNCIYIGTGNNSDFINNASNDFWEYSLASGKWKRIADIPGAPLRCASAFALGNYGYVCLGISDTTYTNATWRYDPSSNSWLQIATYPGDLMADGVAFTIGQNGYIGTGGYDGNCLSDFWAYTPDDLLGMPHPIIVNPYPNPAKNTVNFKYSNVPSLPAQLTVIDILGKEVNSTTITNSSGQIAIDITGYNSGVYFYELTADGKSLMAGKILIGR